MPLDSARAKVIGRLGGLKGGRTRAAQFTSAGQSYAASCVPQEKRVRGGRTRARQLVAAGQVDLLRTLARRWRLEHPTGLEQRLIAVLAELGLEAGHDYFREHEVAIDGVVLAVDVAFPDRSLALEVHGPIHDADLAAFAATIAANDLIRAGRLRAAGFDVLYLHHASVDDWPRLVAGFLGIGAAA